MRTITTVITHNIYTYDELSDSAKENVKEWYLNDPDRNYIFNEDIEYDLKYLFGEHHNMDIEYSLNYCQGDGFNIFGSVAVGEIIKFLKERKLWGDFKKYHNALTDDEMNTILLYAKDTDSIELPKNRYSCFCMADYIEFADEWKEQLEWSIKEGCAVVDSIDMELINKFEKLTKGLFAELCKMYEKWGYEYLYEVDEGELQDMCEANEWEFYEDGSLY